MKASSGGEMTSGGRKAKIATASTLSRAAYEENHRKNMKNIRHIISKSGRRNEKAAAGGGIMKKIIISDRKKKGMEWRMAKSEKNESMAASNIKAYRNNHRAWA